LVKSLDHAVFKSLAGSDDDHRQAAFRSFEQLAMPNPKQEAWKYVEIDFDLDEHVLAAAGATPMPDDMFLTALEDAGGRVTIVDGHTISIGVDPAVDAVPLRVGREAAPSLISPDLDKFAAANHAFGVDGVLIRVPKGTEVAAPIVIDVQQVTPNSLGFPSISVEAEEGSAVSIVVLFRSPDGSRVALAPNISLVVGDRARVGFTTAQLMGSDGLVVNHLRVRLGNDASIRLGEVGLGGRYARLDLGIELSGNGSSAELAGLSFGEHRQVMDYRVVVDHIGHDTSSKVFIKGAVEDEAQSVFTGLLRIEPHAFRTSAFETNRNLVLSPGAKAHSVPNLEILCDDVMCGHGSSVGPLEEEHLYYLESRGLSKQRAERLLINGFFSEVVGRLPVAALAQPLLDLVARRFAAAQEAGRVA
jgi:Fe-S cluster assembly protein SufD